MSLNQICLDAESLIRKLTLCDILTIHCSVQLSLQSLAPGSLSPCWRTTSVSGTMSTSHMGTWATRCHRLDWPFPLVTYEHTLYERAR